ncbi:MAG: YraN family protein [Candidatus Levybacteria bacterium]|nr:YraN family protein [Candidatus Levybacteria bacterium]
MRISNPIGVLGEEAACRYLMGLGYTIIERNFRKGYGEIDIIATHKDVLVFIEVKTRTSEKFGTPFEAVSQKKLQTLLKGVNFYKYVLHPELPDTIRIDAIGVTVRNGVVINIEQIENITQF